MANSMVGEKATEIAAEALLNQDGSTPVPTGPAVGLGGASSGSSRSAASATGKAGRRQEKVLTDSLEDLASQWNDFSITKGIEDGVVVVMNGSGDPGGQERKISGGCCLVGSLLSIRGGGAKLIEKAMVAAWKLLRPMAMEIVEDNLFVFRFESELDYNKVLREGPWRFDDFLMAFKEYRAAPMPKNEELSSVPFWIQVIGLPVKWQNDRMVRYVGSLLGEVMDSDPTVKRLEETREQFLRVRVDLSVLQEIPRGTVLRYGKEEYHLAFKYERLPNFCFYCGFVDHVIMDCESMIVDGKSVKDCKYGIWLRGYPPRGMHPGMVGGVGMGAGARNPFARPPPTVRSSLSLAGRRQQTRLSAPPGLPPKQRDVFSFGSNNPFQQNIRAAPPKLALPAGSERPKAPPRKRVPKKKGEPAAVPSVLGGTGQEGEGDDSNRNKKKRVASFFLGEEESKSAGGGLFPDPIMD